MPERGQWLIAYTSINARRIAYWYNPVLLDDTGCPCRTWVLPTPDQVLVPRSADTSQRPHELVPAVNSQACVDSDVVATQFVADTALQGANKVLATAFQDKYPRGDAPTMPNIALRAPGCRPNCSLLTIILAVTSGKASLLPFMRNCSGGWKLSSVSCLNIDKELRDRDFFTVKIEPTIMDKILKVSAAVSAACTSYYIGILTCCCCRY
jgi:hypothetical protein